MRQSLWEAFDVHPELCYSSSTLAPQAISAAMLRKVPINLNQQAQDATMGLIRAALDRGINVQEVSLPSATSMATFHANFTLSLHDQPTSQSYIHPCPAS